MCGSQSAIEATLAAAMPIKETQTGGSGSMGLLTLLLAPLMLLRRANRTIAARVSAVMGVAILLTACGGRGTLSNGSGAASNQSTPNNNPSFASIPSADAPNSNASFSLQIAAALSDETDESNASGTVNVTLNRHNGLLQGAIRHGVVDATHAVIYHETTGEGVVFLGKADANLFRVPAGTRLTADQINAFEAGDLFAMIHSEAYPKGEIQADLE